MRSISTLIFILSIIILLNTVTFAKTVTTKAEQEDKNAPAVAVSVESAASTEEAKSFFELSGSMTLMNEYNIGDRLKNWMDSTMASGSPAFFNFGGAVLMPLDREGEWYLGVGASLNVPPSHGVWGTSWSGFTRREFHLDPYIFSVDAPIRYNLKDMGMSITVTPSLLLAFCYGGYTGSIGPAPFSHYNVSATGLGFGLSSGMQFYFDDNLGVDAKVGMRMLNAAIAMDTGSTGYLTPDDSDGDIPLDLGGAYMTVGMLFKF